ncbi:MAG: hypothetical protein JXX28_07745 [Deltaproteobacteria bacterium]|nr:hypothetical protein [Deltaproteobacteria bacterium]
MFTSLFVLWVASAQATSTFPSEVSDAVGMPCTPSCAVCHASASGGGAASQPFGQALTARGLQPYDAGSLQGAMVQLEADGVDSDGDGVPDVDALLAGDDPNGGPALCAEAGPRYGCLSHAPRVPGALLLLSALGLVAITGRARAPSR